MTPEEKKELSEHISAIGKILDKQTKPEQVNTLAKIEETVREQVLEHTSPQIGICLGARSRFVLKRTARCAIVMRSMTLPR